MSDCIKLLVGDVFNYKNVKIYRKGNLLGIGNGLCERTVDFAGGCPSTISLKNGDGVEFAAPSAFADFSFIGINMPNSVNRTEYEITAIEVKHVEASMFDAEHVRVNITINEKIQNVIFIRSYLIYTKLPVIAVENSIRSNV